MLKRHIEQCPLQNYTLQEIDRYISFIPILQGLFRLDAALSIDE